MDLNMKDSIIKEKNMVKESIFGMTEVSMMEIGIIIRSVEKEYINGVMVGGMKESG